MDTPGNKSTLMPADFTDHVKVKECLGRLKKHFENRDFIVSDVLDEEGNQYVNLVQKGGGVLGIALVGYTYVLEEMGVRFLRLAGTSAGAINTALLTVIGDKKSKKSPLILEALSNLNFFDLVDGHPVAKALIKLFITNRNFSTIAKKWLFIWAALGVFLLTAGVILIGLQVYEPLLKPFTMTAFLLMAFYLLLAWGLAFYLFRLLRRLKNSGYGINPGNFFYDWIKSILKAHGVETVSDLNEKASRVPSFCLREANPAGVASLKGDVTFIASELVSQNKIQFPLMTYLFRCKDHIDELQPAGFIRASMAIPVFFESYYINDIPCHSYEIRKAWKETFNESDPPSVARFVDGGILSNFPIDLFYNPDVTVPRLPSFGIDLDDTTEDAEKNNAFQWPFFGYLLRMFNTIRFYYDKAFLIKYNMYRKGIGKVPLAEFNWLNFGIRDKDKINMFIKGVLAAEAFLLNFDWEEYKKDRVKMHSTLTQQS